MQRYDEKILEKVFKYGVYVIVVATIMFFVINIFFTGNRRNIKLDKALEQDQNNYYVYVYDKSEEAMAYRNLFNDLGDQFSSVGTEVYLAKYKEGVSGFTKRPPSLYIIENKRIIKVYEGGNEIREFIKEITGGE